MNEKDLKELREAGISVKEIAIRYHVSKATVDRALKRYGLTRSKVDLDTNELVRLYEAGFTCNEIAKQFNVSHGVITRRLEKEGFVIDRAENIKKHFDRTHDELYLEIKKDRDNGFTLKMLSEKYKMRIDNVRKLLKKHDYQKSRIKDLTSLTERMKHANDSEMIYLRAIQSYVESQGQYPSVTHLANRLNYTVSSVSEFVKKHQLQEFIASVPVSYRVQQLLSVLNDLKIRYELNNRSLLGQNLEIDVYLPDYKLGFEINPTTTHSVDSVGFRSVDKNYHQRKSLAAIEADVALVHLYDWDFQDLKFKVLKRKLKSLISHHNVIGARLCNVRLISRKESNEFLNTYHFQGLEYNSQYQIGLYYQNQLVAVLTMGKARYSKHDWEIIRYCTSFDTFVSGSFQKLFVYFKKNIADSGQSVITYVDLNKRFMVSNIYARSNFEYDGLTKPNYVWVHTNGDYLKRYETTKAKLVKQGFDEHLSESEIMKARNFSRVFDAGSLKFITILH